MSDSDEAELLRVCEIAQGIFLDGVQVLTLVRFTRQLVEENRRFRKQLAESQAALKQMQNNCLCCGMPPCSNCELIADVLKRQGGPNMSDDKQSRSKTLSCPLNCSMPPGVEMVEVPRPRHAWTDIAICPNEGCGKCFLMVKRQGVSE